MPQIYEREYELTVTLEEVGNTDTANTGKMWEPLYIKRISAVATGFGGVGGTVNVKTVAITGRAQRTLWQSAIVTNLEDRPYEVVQDVAGADITNTGSRIAVARGEILTVDATQMPAGGTINVILLMSTRDVVFNLD